MAARAILLLGVLVGAALACAPVKVSVPAGAVCALWDGTPVAAPSRRVCRGVCSVSGFSCNPVVADPPLKCELSGTVFYVEQHRTCECGKAPQEPTDDPTASLTPCQLFTTPLASTVQCFDAAGVAVAPAARTCRGSCTAPGLSCEPLTKDPELQCRDTATGAKFTVPQHRTCSCALAAPATEATPDMDTTTTALVSDCTVKRKIFTCWTAPNDPTPVTLVARKCDDWCTSARPCQVVERDPPVPCYWQGGVYWLPQDRRCACTL